MTDKLPSPQQVTTSHGGGIFPPPEDTFSTTSSSYHSTQSAPTYDHHYNSYPSEYNSYDTLGAPSSHTHYGMSTHSHHNIPYSVPVYSSVHPPPQTPTNFTSYNHQPESVHTSHYPTTASPYFNFERVAESLTNTSPTPLQQNYHTHSAQTPFSYPSLSPSEDPRGRIPYNFLTLTESLGSGGNGSVHKATYNGKEYAVKLFHVENSLEHLQREFGKLSGLRHRNVVPVYAYFYEEPNHITGNVHFRTGYVMELQNSGSLRTYLQTRGGNGFKEQEALFFARQIASALIYLHDQHIIHNDIKPENICLHKEQGHPTKAKLLDFGAALNRGVTEFSDTRKEKTYRYAAPERFDKYGTCYASDVYSFGIVLNEMVGGKKPFFKLDDLQMMTALRDRDAPADVPKKVSDDLKQLIERCWHPEAKCRPTPAEIITIIDKLRVEGASF